MLLGRRHHLESDQLVSTLLKALDDVANEATLDAIGLDSNEAAHR
jgi:hypothetical protein